MQFLLSKLKTMLIIVNNFQFCGNSLVLFHLFRNYITESALFLRWTGHNSVVV
jgi:hypothetical protein